MRPCCRRYACVCWNLTKNILRYVYHEKKRKRLVICKRRLVFRFNINYNYGSVFWQRIRPEGPKQKNTSCILRWLRESTLWLLLVFFYMYSFSSRIVDCFSCPAAFLGGHRRYRFFKSFFFFFGFCFVSFFFLLSTRSIGLFIKNLNLALFELDIYFRRRDTRRLWLMGIWLAFGWMRWNAGRMQGEY